MVTATRKDDPYYVFICSAGHSGSTLLDLMLGANTQIESLGEITHLPKNLALNTICTCGMPVRECSFWKPVIEEMSGKLGRSILNYPYSIDLGFIDAHVVVDTAHQTWRYKMRQKFLLGSYYLSLRYRVPDFLHLNSYFDRVVQNNHLLFDTVRRHSGKRLVVDSSKSYLKALAYYKADPAHTRIIVLTRDGRGVFYSGLRRGAGQRIALNSWRRHYARALPLYRCHVAKEHLLYVKYETLAREPESEIARLCDFLAVTYEPDMLNFSGTEHHITNGNDMRFASKGIRLDEKWRAEISEDQLEYFGRHAGRLNLSLGYE